MRTTTFAIRNGASLEIFVRRRGEKAQGFEAWFVGDIKGQRSVLDHLLTHDDLEKELSYAQSGDLVWRDGEVSQIPSLQTLIAQENEETIQRESFWPDAYLFCYMASRQLPVERRVLNAAKKHLLGDWTDDFVKLSFGTDHAFRISVPHDLPEHSSTSLRLFSFMGHHNDLDWWNVSSWRLFLMDQSTKRGMRTGMWWCDGNELHLYSGREDVLVHVFHRVQQPCLHLQF